MNFNSTCRVEDECSILWIHSTSWHNDQLLSYLTDESLEHVNALFGYRLLSRGEQSVATQCDNLLDSFLWVSAHVECSMEGDAHALACFDKSLACGEVDVSFFGQGSNHHTIDTKLTAHSDILFHAADFFFGIDKVATAWTNQHIDLQSFKTLGIAYHADRRSKPIFAQRTA